MHASNSLLHEHHTQKLDHGRGEPRVTPVTRVLPANQGQQIAEGPKP